MKIKDNWKKLLKTYSFISIFGNLSVALSISGLSVLGVISNAIAFPLLLTLAVVFGVFGLVGRFIEQEIEDK